MVIVNVMRLRPLDRRRGVALVTAIFFSLLCLMLATAFLLQVPVDLGATAQTERDSKASLIADAGLQDTQAWISHELGQGREPCTVSAASPVREGSLEGWSWSCQVEPDEGTPPNALTAYRIYKLTSVASFEGVPLRKIETVVQAGQSFSRFSMFIDEDDPSLWDFGVSPQTKIRGPVHKNRPIRFHVSANTYAGPVPSDPPFDGLVSTTGSSHVWSTNGNPASQGGKFSHVFKNGAADLQFGTPERPLPSGSGAIANAAWGGTVPAVPPDGVSVNPSGGVYISGAVDSMRLEVNGSGNFLLRLVQGGQTTTVEENSATSSRLVSYPDGSSSTVAGLGNGVIFATGSISSLQGVNKNPHTIAVDFEAGSDIEFSGSVTRADTAVGAEPSGADDRLGIVAEHLYMAPESVLPRNVDNPVHLYATLLATERFEVKNPFSGTPGALAIHGGVAGNLTWKCALIDGNNNRTLSGYGGLSGYGTPTMVYDPVLANAPPPEYPTTAGTELTVRSWVETPL